MQSLLTMMTLLWLSISQSPAPNMRAGIAGDWMEPTGSVIRVTACGQNYCARLIQISPQAPTRVDAHNPDVNLQGRPLCNLQIGSSFHLEDAAHAEGGSLYDPKTGKTYHGSMSLEGGHLLLRGYVGVKLFGRTETWTRPSQPVDVCSR